MRFATTTIHASEATRNAGIIGAFVTMATLTMVQEVVFSTTLSVCSALSKVSKDLFIYKKSYYQLNLLNRLTKKYHKSKNELFNLLIIMPKHQLLQVCVEACHSDWLSHLNAPASINSVFFHDKNENKSIYVCAPKLTLRRSIQIARFAFPTRRMT